jgi:cytochrome P450
MTIETSTEPAPLRTPNGPKGVPILGNLIDLSKDTLGFLQRSANEYGDVVALQLGKFPTLLITESDLVEQVLLKKHTDFMKNRVFWRQLKALMGNGILTAEGAEWQRQRKVAAPAFATHPLQKYASHMAQFADTEVALWKSGQTLDINQAAMDVTLRVAAQTLLGVDVQEDLPRMELAARWVNDEVAARFSRPFEIPDYVPLPGHIRYMRGVKIVDEIVYRSISEHKAGRIVSDGFLAQLMQARDENGEPLSTVQLRDQVMNMFLAGYETTALTIGWALLLLGKYRDIQAEIAEEIKTVVGDRTLTFEDLSNLPKLERATIESTRLYPAAWGVGREAIRDTSIGDYDVPKGTTMIMSSWVTQRRPDYFEDPLAFKPERWTAEFRKKLPRFAYYPFGGGPRICIGNRFAMMEAMLMLATMIRRFDVECLTPEEEVKLVASVTLRPKDGIRVKLHERNG